MVYYQNGRIWKHPKLPSTTGTCLKAIGLCETYFCTVRDSIICFVANIADILHSTRRREQAPRGKPHLWEPKPKGGMWTNTATRLQS